MYYFGCTIDIYVKIQMETVNLNIDETLTTIGMVKRDLVCSVLHCEIPLDQLQLSFEGRKLEDGSRLLCDYDICDQSMLDLKFRGGKYGHVLFIIIPHILYYSLIFKNVRPNLYIVIRLEFYHCMQYPY